MTAPTPVAFTHVPTPVHALQFDGTVPSLLAIFGAATKDPNGAQVIVNFGPGGVAQSVALNGANLGLSFNITDWIVFPDDGSRMFAVTAEVFAASWQGA